MAFVIGTVLVVLGAALFVGALALGNWDFKSLSTEEYEMNTCVIEEKFFAISVNTDTADVAFALSEDGACRVMCEERKKLKHSVTVKDGTLSVKLEDTRKWYDHITFFSFGKEKVTVYLPEAEYESLSVKNDTGHVDIPNVFSFGSINVTLSTGGVNLAASAAEDVRIKTSTGSINVDGISAGKLELVTSTGRVTVNKATCSGNINIRVSTGKATLADVTCADLFSDGNTGDITLKNVIASGAFDIERSTGDVRFDACDAAAIDVKTDTGDVKGTFLTDKIFSAKTDTGRIRVPTSVAGGLCKIETDTGDIEIDINK